MKKAMLFSELGMIILSLACVIILTLIFIRIHQISDRSNYESACRGSIATYSLLSSGSKLTTLGGSSAEADQKDVDCPTQYFSFKKRTSKTKQTKQIADLMAQCYNIYGEGKLQLVPVNGKMFCGICSVIEFEDKTQILTGVPNYIMAYKTKYKFDDNRITYYQYFTGKAPSAKLLDFAKTSTYGTIYGSKRYVIMYIYMRYNAISFLTDKVSNSAWGRAGMVFSPLPTLGISYVANKGEMKEAAEKHDALGGDDAALMVAEYNADEMSQLGCDSVPFSQLEKRFR